ncbi:MAG: flavodoxin domain-containing protein [Acidithiobacillus sp.]|nr:flavodoxin domain-containing protein [Acidithiobacillus sp.]
MESLQPLDTPLDSSKRKELQRFAEGLSREQLLWVGGYLTGVGNAANIQGTSDGIDEHVTILFGTETGNAKRLAEALVTKARASGVQVNLQDMLTYSRARMRQDRTLLVIVSTHGDGDPPDTARALHTFLTGNQVPDLRHLRFSVLALGDASYPRFCQVGKEFDTALAAAGAKRLLPRVDCDVDYEERATHWMEQILATVTARPSTPLPTSILGKGRFGHTYFPAALVEKVRLSGHGSSREVWHLELDLNGSGLHYVPGDIVSVNPTNPPQLVEELLDRLKLDPRAPVQARHGETPLMEALATHYEITKLTRPFLERYASLGNTKELRSVLAERDINGFISWMDGREIIDIVDQYPVDAPDAQAFVDCLRPLPPRRYSIASSLMAAPGEMHLVVAAVRYTSHGRERMGVASTFLADRVAVGGPVPVSIEPNAEFRLPEDPEQAVIMIGAGTGVAPFRAFLQEREALGAGGGNWLFFGDRHFSTDFLYQREWLRWLKDGRLTRMDVAFSRDQEHKVYVQDQLRARAGDMYAWLEEGAAVYVCGAEAMGRSVQRTLVEIIQLSGRTLEQAEEYILELKQAGRYHRDVY